MYYRCSYSMYFKPKNMQLQVCCPFMSPMSMYCPLMAAQTGMLNQGNNKNILPANKYNNESLNTSTPNQNNTLEIPVQIKIEVPNLPESLSEEDKNKIIESLDGTKIKDLLIDKLDFDSTLASTDRPTVYETQPLR